MIVFIAAVGNCELCSFNIKFSWILHYQYSKPINESFISKACNSIFLFSILYHIMKKIILVSFGLSVSIAALAQKDSTDKKSHGKFSLEYASNSVFNGRKDSVVTPYITPSIGYEGRSGFYINGSFSYLPRSGDSRIDEFSVDAGYDFSIGNFDGEIAAGKEFYNTNSTNVSAEEKGSLTARAAYDFQVVSLFLSPSIHFNQKSDIALSAGLEHEFNPNEGDFTITPAACFNGSTLNFYQSYFDRRKYKDLKKNNPGSKVKATIKNASTFSLLDYEFSLPAAYKTGNFTFTVTPYYTVPLNPAEVTVQITPNIGPIRTNTFTEKLSNTFYISLSAECRF